MLKILLYILLNMSLGFLCTTVVGEKHNNKYSKRINNYGSDVSIDVLTDMPELYPNCKTTLYSREAFSYYDKMMFLLDSVKAYKSRVTHIDVDWFYNIDYNTKVEEDTFYTYHIFDYNQPKETSRSPNNYQLLVRVLNTILYNNGYDSAKCKHLIGEAFMSLPYLDNFSELYDRVKSMQIDFETKLNSSTGFGSRYSKYQNTGVGYNEGMALTVVMDYLGMKYEKLHEKKFYKTRNI